jgi:hypothetical protein
MPEDRIDFTPATPLSALARAGLFAGSAKKSSWHACAASVAAIS